MFQPGARRSGLKYSERDISLNRFMKLDACPMPFFLGDNAPAPYSGVVRPHRMAASRFAPGPHQRLRHKWQKERSQRDEGRCDAKLAIHGVGGDGEENRDGAVADVHAPKTMSFRLTARDAAPVAE